MDKIERIQNLYDSGASLPTIISEIGTDDESLRLIRSRLGTAMSTLQRVVAEIRDEAIANYRTVRTAHDAAHVKADAAFKRYFSKLQRGERTNGAATARLENEANYLAADLSVAQGKLFALDLNPWDIDDADGVERTTIL